MGACVTYSDLFAYTVMLVAVITASSAAAIKIYQWFYEKRDNDDHGKKKK